MRKANTATNKIHNIKIESIKNVEVNNHPNFLQYVGCISEICLQDIFGLFNRLKFSANVKEGPVNGHEDVVEKDKVMKNPEEDKNMVQSELVEGAIATN